MKAKDFASLNNMYSFFIYKTNTAQTIYTTVKFLLPVSVTLSAKKILDG
jgi:hypothetical protein